MTKFTKEQRDILIKTAEYMVKRENTSEYSENIRRVAEIALAALTADASMYASEETLICAEQGEFLLRTLNRPAGDATIPLYRLPLLEILK